VRSVWQPFSSPELQVLALLWLAASRLVRRTHETQPTPRATQPNRQTVQTKISLRADRPLGQEPASAQGQGETPPTRRWVMPGALAKTVQ
jgi:hypothetical protein